MSFDYDVMPKRSKENSKGEVMRECNNCGERTCMLYEEDENYRVVCEHCDEQHTLKTNSAEKAMKIWNEFVLQADCEYCPLGWEERSYEGECYDCGCFVKENKDWCNKKYSERLEKSKEFDY